MSIQTLLATIFGQPPPAAGPPTGATPPFFSQDEEERIRRGKSDPNAPPSAGKQIPKPLAGGQPIPLGNPEDAARAQPIPIARPSEAGTPLPLGNETAPAEQKAAAKPTASPGPISPAQPATSSVLDESEFFKQHPEREPGGANAAAMPAEYGGAGFPSGQYRPPSFLKRLGMMALGAAGGAMTGIPATREGGKALEQIPAGWASQQRAAQAAATNAPQLKQQAEDKAYQEYLDRQAKIAGISKSQADAEKARMDAVKAGRPPEEKIGQTVETGDGLYQWNPDTQRYDIRVGPGKSTENVKSPFELYLKSHPDATYEQYQEAVAKTTPKESALKPEIVAQIGMPPDAKTFPKGEKDPAYLAANQKWGKEYEAHVEAQAAAAGQSRGAAYGRNRPVSVLDTWNGNRPVTVSAADAEDNPERYATQTGAVPALKSKALISDIRASAGNVQDDLKALKNGFDVDTRARLAAALADPASTAMQFVQSVPRGSLTSDQQDYVIDLFSLREQIMALRGVLGAGQGSEDLRRAIVQTIPGPGTPDEKYAEKQIKRVLQVLDRLEQGVPGVPLAPKPGEKKGAAAAAAAGPPGDPENLYPEEHGKH